MLKFDFIMIFWKTIFRYKSIKFHEFVHPVKINYKCIFEIIFLGHMFPMSVFNSPKTTDLIIVRSVHALHNQRSETIAKCPFQKRKNNFTFWLKIRQKKSGICGWRLRAFNFCVYICIHIAFKNAFKNIRAFNCIIFTNHTIRI